MEGTEQPHHDDYVYALRERNGDTSRARTRSRRFPGSPLTFPRSSASSAASRFEPGRKDVFEAKRRVRDPNTSALAAVWICNECVARMAQFLAEEPAGSPWLLGWEVWSQRGTMRP